MYWNEKIDVVKKKYSDKDFSVPHVQRKEILRKIESKFVKRNENYYDLNNSNKRFTNWWDNLSTTNYEPESENVEAILTRRLKPNQDYWIACEFPYEILIYRSKIPPMINLISMGVSRTKIYHIIGLKYDFMLSMKMEVNQIAIKCSEDNNLVNK